MSSGNDDFVMGGRRQHGERESFFSNRGAGLHRLAMHAPLIDAHEVSPGNLDVFDQVLSSPSSRNTYEEEPTRHQPAPLPVEATAWPTQMALPPSPAPSLSTSPYQSRADAPTVALTRSLATKVFLGTSVAAGFLFVAGTFLGLALGRMVPQFNAPASGLESASLRSVMPPLSIPVVAGAVEAEPWTIKVAAFAPVLDNDVADEEFPVKVQAALDAVPGAQDEQPGPRALVPAQPEPLPAFAAGPDGDNFSVQVGAYLVADNATPMVAKLADLGVAARQSQRVDAKGRTWHYVRAGSFFDKNEALQLASILRAQGVNGFVVDQKRGK